MSPITLVISQVLVCIRVSWETRWKYRFRRLWNAAEQEAEVTSKEGVFLLFPCPSLAVQWLTLHASTAESTGLIPGRETKIAHAVWCSHTQRTIFIVSPGDFLMQCNMWEQVHCTMDVVLAGREPTSTIKFSFFCWWLAWEALGDIPRGCPLELGCFEPRTCHHSDEEGLWLPGCAQSLT